MIVRGGCKTVEGALTPIVLQPVSAIFALKTAGTVIDAVADDAIETGAQFMYISGTPPICANHCTSI